MLDKINMTERTAIIYTIIYRYVRKNLQRRRD